MHTDPLIGSQLANFRVERLVGRGGMAQVYYGWDVKLDRPVAIKVIDTHFRGDPAYAARFVREAQSVAKWRHENIIQVYFAGEQGELYYFVMEYIDGQDLGALISQYRKRSELMPHDEALRIGWAIAKALDYAHQKSVIHRDVKPANVMVAQDGRVVLSDFGLALDVEQGSLGEAFGSSHYIAPEQARRSADAISLSDLYSLGIILYEMLTGFVPFDDPSPTTVALQHITLPPPPPRQINPRLNQETENVLLKALSKVSQERYQSGQALMQALQAALLGTSDSQSPELSASPSDSLIGKQLDEYLVESLLGQGGMARIYHGFDVRLERHVAIKVMDVPFRTDSDYIMRFEREARAIAQLDHPHIVRLYRYGESNGLLYMAMQYIEGSNLGVVLAGYRLDGEFVTPQNILRIVREICQALDCAHKKGVIHRDVKPTNIMLDRHGCAFLTDFGLALLTEVGTRGEIFGSPHYIAPEQAISSAKVVPQSDLYSLGIILYEMFTGKLPFDAPDPLDIAMLHLSEPPPLPRELRPDLSPEVEAVILKAIAKEPDDRYKSGAILADALEKAIQTKAAPPPALVVPPIPHPVVQKESKPVVVVKPQPPTPMTEKIEKEPVQPQGRGRLVKMGGVLLALLALAAIIFFLTRGGGDQGEPKETRRIAAASTATATTTAKSSPIKSPLGTPTMTRTASPTRTATATRTPSPTASKTPTPTPTASKTPTPTRTETPEPTLATTASVTPTVETPTPVVLITTTYKLLIRTHGSDSLLLINRGVEPLPLEHFCLGDCERKTKAQVEGAEWKNALLESGACVVVEGKQNDPQLPPLPNCERVGQTVKRGEREVFWLAPFAVYYGGELQGVCEPDHCFVWLDPDGSWADNESPLMTLYLPIVLR